MNDFTWNILSTLPRVISLATSKLLQLLLLLHDFLVSESTVFRTILDITSSVPPASAEVDGTLLGTLLPFFDDGFFSFLVKRFEKWNRVIFNQTDRVATDSLIVIHNLRQSIVTSVYIYIQATFTMTSCNYDVIITPGKI